MSESFFEPLEQVMLPGDSFLLRILKGQTGLVLLVQPSLGKKPVDFPKEAEEIRAALEIPLRLAGSAAELDAVYSAKIRGWGAARRETYDTLETLIHTLNEASKQAQTKTAQTRKKISIPPPSQNRSGGSTSASASEAVVSETSKTGPTPPAPAESGASQVSMF